MFIINKLLVNIIEMYFLTGCNAILMNLNDGVKHHIISNDKIPKAQPHPNATKIPQKNDSNL